MSIDRGRNLSARLTRAEMALYGGAIDPARVVELANAGKMTELTDGELTWLIEQYEADFSPATRAEMNALWESLSLDDLTAMSEGRAPSPEGEAIMARIEELRGDGSEAHT